MVADAHLEPLEPMGHALLHHFVLSPNYTNLNHGSYGASPKAVLDAERRWQLQMEANPDHWFRSADADGLAGSLDVVRARLARYIGASDPQDLVFVDGASAGVNAVLRSIRLPPSSAILYLNTAYQMVKNTVRYVHEHDQLEKPLEVPIDIPSSDDDVVAAVERALEANPTVRLASFSHITSVPAIILPVKRLVRACHNRGVLVLIDGAHALGQIPIDVEDIGADFYVANGHKWLYSPKGSAILWANRSKQSLIHPNVINYEGQGATPFQLQFEYTGTKDYSAFLAMSDAMDFRRAVLGGDDRIMTYMHTLASAGGSVLAEAWRTEKLTSDTQIGAMVNVRMPDEAVHCCDLNFSGALLSEYGTFVPVYPWKGQCYVRVSCQVYNELSDFAMLAQAVLKLLRSRNCGRSDLAQSSDVAFPIVTI
eukprot:TRINITY_DN47936_c0_g1_i1.p1 TRINITY_DN47936_c0_g1~~TRINITY_DN47936_c0_g1_i1.p1  ORF type:complete len:469 (-),score=79.21 TRINITY_DN47936_c0_g1_i1:9-1280(-)